MTTATTDTIPVPFTRHDFPTGEAVFYRDADHTYFRDFKQNRDGTYSGSGRLTGISTVVKPLDYEPNSLMRWASRIDLEGVAQLYGHDPEGPPQRTVPRCPKVLRRALEDEGLSWTSTREERAATGTAVHLRILYELAQGKTPDPAVLAPHERPFARSVYGWWLANDPDPLFSEQVVCDLELGIAGTLDLRCLIRRGELAGAILLLDLKSTVSGYVSQRSFGQVVGYDHSFEACGLGPRADRLALLVARPDGKPAELIPVDPDREPFLNVVKTYRDSARYGCQARKARELIRGVRA